MTTGPSGATRLSRAADRVGRICRSHTGSERELRATVLAELRTALPFDAYAWLLTDPQTRVGTAPLAEIPDLAALPRLIRLKYLTPLNRWTELPAGHCVSLAQATGGHPEMSRLWRDLLAGFDVSDVASMAFRDRFGMWGFLDLWRCGGRASTFTAAELTVLATLHSAVTTALRAGVAATFAAPPAAGVDRSVAALGGQAVILLTDDLEPLGQTGHVDEQLRRLLPTPPGAAPVPAAALNVAAALLAREQGVDSAPAAARAQLSGTNWISVRAARLAGTPSVGADGPGSPIAITIEPVPPSDRVQIYALATGLTPRERALLHDLVHGNDTVGLARRLRISQLTVQDHLTAIFRKTGTMHRGELISRALGG